MRKLESRVKCFNTHAKTLFDGDLKFQSPAPSDRRRSKQACDLQLGPRTQRRSMETVGTTRDRSRTKIYFRWNFGGTSCLWRETNLDRGYPGRRLTGDRFVFAPCVCGATGRERRKIDGIGKSQWIPRGPPRWGDSSSSNNSRSYYGPRRSTIFTSLRDGISRLVGKTEVRRSAERTIKLISHSCRGWRLKY